MMEPHGRAALLFNFQFSFFRLEMEPHFERHHVDGHFGCGVESVTIAPSFYFDLLHSEPVVMHSDAESFDENDTETTLAGKFGIHRIGDFVVFPTFCGFQEQVAPDTCFSPNVDWRVHKVGHPRRPDDDRHVEVHRLCAFCQVVSITHLLVDIVPHRISSDEDAEATVLDAGVGESVVVVKT